MIPRERPFRPSAPSSDRPDPVYAPDPTTVEVVDWDFDTTLGTIQVTLDAIEGDTLAELEDRFTLTKAGETRTIYKAHVVSTSRRTRTITRPQA